jgi:hypothetical protein
MSKANQGRSFAIRGFPSFQDAYPAQIRRKLPYVANFTVVGSATVGVIGTAYTLSLNSLYDPDVSGTGHQPYGFDQYCSSTGPYLRYKVVGVKAHVTATSPGSPIYLYTQVKNVIDTYSVAGKDTAEAAEKPTVRQDFISSAGAQSKSFTVDIPSLHVLFNWSKRTFDIDMGQTTGPYNNDPGSTPTILFAAAYPTVASRSLDLTVKLEYDVIFYDRQILATS